MSNEELIKELLCLRDLGNTVEGSEFDYYECCAQRDYQGHKEDCKRVKFINEIILILERN